VLLSRSSQRDTPVDAVLTGALEKKVVIPVLLDERARNNWIWPLVADRQTVERIDNEPLEFVAKRVAAAVDDSRATGENGLRATHGRRVTRLMPLTSALVAVFVLGLGGSLLLRNNFMLRKELATGELALDRTRVNLLARLATAEDLRSNSNGALRFAAYSVRLAIGLDQPETGDLAARTILALAVPRSVTQLAVPQSVTQLIVNGRDERVMFASLSPDYAWIVTVSSDGITAWVSDLRSGMVLSELTSQGKTVWSAEWSPDGKRIVTASDDHTARIWEAATGKVIAVLAGHSANLSYAAWSPDGQHIVTVSDDHTARIWEAATGKVIVTLVGHENGLTYAAWSPDGQRIVTVSRDDTARIWEAATGEEIAVLRYTDGLSYAAWSPDGKSIMTLSWDGTVQLWDTTAAYLKVRKFVGHGGKITNAAWSPDATRIVTVSGDDTAQIWDAATGQEIMILRGPSAVVHIAWSPDGRGIITVSSDGTVQFWDSRPPKESPKDLLAEVCTLRLAGATRLTRNEMRLAGYPDSIPEIDVCEGVGSARGS
jgi:WD40 repeat protein